MPLGLRVYVQDDIEFQVSLIHVPSCYTISKQAIMTLGSTVLRRILASKNNGLAVRFCLSGAVAYAVHFEAVLIDKSDGVAISGKMTMGMSNTFVAIASNTALGGNTWIRPVELCHVPRERGLLVRLVRVTESCCSFEPPRPGALMFVSLMATEFSIRLGCPLWSIR